MEFSKTDLKPNKPIPWAAIRAGSTTDARWRNVPASVKQISALDARSDSSRQKREAAR